MEHRQFDDLIRSLTKSRRSLFGGALAAAAGWLGLSAADAKKRRKKRKKRSKRQQVGTSNAFGCLDVGDPCASADQCCSGICTGKKGKRTCRAHDTGGCPAGHDAFGDDAVSCQTSAGIWGKCGTTTGNAGYCVGGGDCHPCANDADCRSLCGPQAACVVSPQGCAIGTACVDSGGGLCLL
jgi:hypothetical protein